MALATSPLATRPFAASEPQSSGIVSSSVTFAGVGAFNPTGQGLFSSSATIAGIGNFNPNAQGLVTSYVALSGSGALNPNAQGLFIVAPNLASVGSFNPKGQGNVSTSLTLAGVGALNPTGQGVLSSYAVLAGVGTFAPTSSSGSVVSSNAIMAGIGAFNPTGQGQISSSASLSGVGVLNPNGFGLFSSNATLAGSGNFSPKINGFFITSAVLSGVGTLLAYGSSSQVISSYAILSGVGGLVAYIPTNNTLVFLPNSYASLEMARLYLTEWDDYALAMALEVATGLINDYLKINYLQAVSSEIYKAQYERKIFLNRGPINSIISVAKISENTQKSLGFIPANYYANNEKFLTIYPSANQMLIEHLPKNRYELFEVTYDAGYVTTPTTGYTLVPSALAKATIETAKSILMARTADFNVAGENAAGAYALQYNVRNVGNIPETTKKTLQPYRRTAMW